MSLIHFALHIKIGGSSTGRSRTSPCPTRSDQVDPPPLSLAPAQGHAGGAAAPHALTSGTVPLAASRRQYRHEHPCSSRARGAPKGRTCITKCAGACGPPFTNLSPVIRVKGVWPVLAQFVPELGDVTTASGAAPGQQWRPHSGLSCSDRALRTFHLNHTDKAHHQELMLLSVQLITDHFLKK